jgi:hypothetical protein
MSPEELLTRSGVRRLPPPEGVVVQPAMTSKGVAHLDVARVGQSCQTWPTGLDNVSPSFDENYSPPRGPIEVEPSAEFKTIVDFCDEYQPIAYVIEPIVRTGSLYTLTAKTGAGKTALLIIIALAVATGRADLLGVPVRKGRVAYIVAENPDGFRMRVMVAAYVFNIDLRKIENSFVVLDQRMKPEEIGAKLRKLAEDGPFSLVIGDTLQALFDGDDLNHNVQIGAFMRRWRSLTQIGGNPAVIIAAHPVKNAPPDNLIPYGGGAALNEVDGNLTLALSLGGVTQLHSQGKLRGIEFEPVKFRFEGMTSPDVKDIEGREVQLPVMRPVSDDEAGRREESAISRQQALLWAMLDNPSGTVREWAATAKLSKSAADRLLKNFKTDKLAENSTGRWTLTSKGRKACLDSKSGMGQENA